MERALSGMLQEFVQVRIQGSANALRSGLFQCVYLVKKLKWFTTVCVWISLFSSTRCFCAKYFLVKWSLISVVTWRKTGPRMRIGEFLKTSTISNLAKKATQAECW